MTCSNSGSIDDIQLFLFSSVSLGERAYRICHQDVSQTFAICSEKYDYDHRYKMITETVKCFVHLLNDKTFAIISSFALGTDEHGSCILSCSFADDNNLYICVGTACVYRVDSESRRGRILVFKFEDGQLQLVSEIRTNGAVYNLTAFNGKLVAGINETIEVYQWMHGSRTLQYECGHHGHILSQHVQCRGDFIVVGDHMKSIYFGIQQSWGAGSCVGGEGP